MTMVAYLAVLATILLPLFGEEGSESSRWQDFSWSLRGAAMQAART
ncbi:protein of unknown function [Candidatus Hydrogenisulfobacillus filiaventi]|uniref:Uncharacterized protein n=1 Tax=Candidatus Hydrogenisulfobacillus filiaventi TaxID=2707344 RepID=A0A6F8ZJ41_9FIRM|nr:protein of unknown function [Candidatus Hydrogenisulfobacillus filiaventi]